MGFMAQKQRGEGVRSRLFNIRVSPADRNVIDRAARLTAKPAQNSCWKRRAARRRNAAGYHVLLVDAATFNRFKALLDAPPNANARLQELIRRRAPWGP